jgi:hypothetical protein
MLTTCTNSRGSAESDKDNSSSERIKCIRLASARSHGVNNSSAKDSGGEIPVGEETSDADAQITNPIAVRPNTQHNTNFYYSNTAFAD